MEAAPRGRVSQGSFPTNAPRMWLGSPEEPNGKPLRLPHPAPPPGRPARPLPCPGHQGPWGSTAHRCPLASTFSLLVPLPVSPSALKGQPPDGRPRPAAPRLCGSPHTLCCPLSMLGWLPTPARLRPLLGHILDRAPRGAGGPVPGHAPLRGPGQMLRTRRRPEAKGAGGPVARRSQQRACAPSPRTGDGPDSHSPVFPTRAPSPLVPRPGSLEARFPRGKEPRSPLLLLLAAPGATADRGRAPWGPEPHGGPGDAIS